MQPYSILDTTLSVYLGRSTQHTMIAALATHGTRLLLPPPPPTRPRLHICRNPPKSGLRQQSDCILKQSPSLSADDCRYHNQRYAATMYHTTPRLQLLPYCILPYLEVGINLLGISQPLNRPLSPTHSCKCCRQDVQFSPTYSGTVQLPYRIG